MASLSIDPPLAPHAAHQWAWPRLARLLAGAAVVGAIIGSVG